MCGLTVKICTFSEDAACVDSARSDGRGLQKCGISFGIPARNMPKIYLQLWELKARKMFYTLDVSNSKSIWNIF